jgi:hypothetical protein
MFEEAPASLDQYPRVAAHQTGRDWLQIRYAFINQQRNTSLRS